MSDNREVTEAMVRAAYNAAKSDGLTGPRSDCERFVKVVIEAALRAQSPATVALQEVVRDMQRSIDACPGTCGYDGFRLLAALSAPKEGE